MTDIHAKQFDKLPIDRIVASIAMVKVIQTIAGGQVILMERILNIEFTGEMATLTGWVIVLIAIDGQSIGNGLFQEAGGTFQGTAQFVVFGAVTELKDPAETTFANEFVI